MSSAIETAHMDVPAALSGAFAGIEIIAGIVWGGAMKAGEVGA